MKGLVVTKFDTVSTKVGATMTLPHETGVPIVFCGTGQKYHHLKKLIASDVVRTLFSSSYLVNKRKRKTVIIACFVAYSGEVLGGPIEK